MSNHVHLIAQSGLTCIASFGAAVVPAGYELGNYTTGEYDEEIKIFTISLLKQ